MDNNRVLEILKKYPNRIPVILNVVNKEIKLQKNKFLVYPSLMVGMFIYTLLHNNNLKSSDSIYLTTQNGIMISTKDTFEYLHHNYKNIDNILYLNCIKENVFG